MPRGDGGIGDATLDAPEGRRSPTEGSSPHAEGPKPKEETEGTAQGEAEQHGRATAETRWQDRRLTSQAKGPRPKEETGGTALDMEAPKGGPFIVTRHGDPEGRTPLSYQTLRSYWTLRHLC